MSVTKQIFRLFFREAWQFKYRVVFSVLNTVIVVLVSSFAAPLVIASFLEKIQSGSSITLSETWPLIAIYGVAQFYGEVIGWRLTLLSTWTFETSAQRNLNNKIFRHLTNQTMKFHSDRFGGSLVSQSNKLIGSFERFWDTIIFQIATTVTSVIAAVVILSFVFWQYALFLAILSIVFSIAIVWGSKFMAKLNLEEAQAGTRNTGILADVITNMLTVKSYGHEDYEAERYDKNVLDWRHKSINSMWGFLKVSSIYSGLIAILNVVALTIAVWAAEHQIISISLVYLSITYTLTVARQLWEMNNIMRNYHRIMGDAYDMTEILDIASNVKDEKHPEDISIRRGQITFDNVGFGHGKNDKLFKSLNLNIKQGEKVGLVGHSGSGKTTLTKLLLRFMDIDSGKIYIDGQNIAKLRQSEFRKYISYVPQEPMLFHRSLADNIRYGMLDADDDVVRGVAKMAHADEFINTLPEGYKTLVGERGVKLSGGQRQRIAIARAMIKNAPILVLDEATSALDSESEELIQDALWKLMEGRTAIVIAHRLSTIQKMDRILVMDNGKIVEQGSHKELIRLNGVYAKLWQKQTGGFIEE